MLIFLMSYLGIEKIQATIPQCKKPPISNSDVSDLLNPYGRRNMRQFMNILFGYICRNWSLHISRSNHWLLDTWFEPERDYLTNI